MNKNNPFKIQQKTLPLKPFLIGLLWIMCAYPLAVIAQQSPGNDSQPLSVGIAGSEPFVFADSNTGISLDIWEQIAQQKSWQYDYVSFDNVDAALQALDQGTIDVAVGPISITAKRLEKSQFSQPFYNSSISIISRIEDQSLWGKIKPLFSLKLLMAVAVFLIILAIVGTLLWLAERKKSPDQFPHKPTQGIGTGMWLAVVTMSTVGYGDKAPVTLLGRIITGSWIVISLIFATTMVAGIASTLSLSSVQSTTISTIEQISGKKTATITGSSSEEVLAKAQAKIVASNNLKEAIDKLERKEVEAVVFDRPQLLYYIKEHHKEALYISKAEYYKQGYGFAFSKNSALVYDVNRTLLELAESQTIKEIILNYIEKDE